MRLAIVSDEISRDLQTAVEIGRSWGINAYEIRRLGSGRVPRVNEDDIKEALYCKSEFGITITSLSTGLFKIPADHPEVEQRLREELPRACELAHRLGTDILVDFGFGRSMERHAEHCPDQVVALIGRVADGMKAGGCRFVLENEHVTWADTGEHTAAILDRLNHPNVFVNWDPTNAAHFQETVFPDGYAAVRRRVAHVHVKDFDRANDKVVVPPGEGGVNWREQFRALIADGYQGWVVVETHMRPKVESSRRCVAAVKDMLCEICGT